MPQSRIPQPGTRPHSADFTFPARVTPNKTSMLYSMLPSAVQSRLPRLPSLRRSVSMYGMKGSRSSPVSGRSTPFNEEDAGGALVLREGEMGLDYFGDMIEDREEQRLHSELGTGGTRALDLEEKASGIGWKFAGQGISLLSLSVSESTTLSMNSNPALGSAPFARQLYIHALTYLLRGLPSDLSADEQLSVRCSLPQPIQSSLVPSDPLNPSKNPSIQYDRRSAQQHPPSLLHRTIASTIVQLFLLAQLLLPYLQATLAAAYKYERRYRVSEMVLGKGMDAVDMLGRKGIDVGGIVWGLGAGELVAWVIEGVMGGIREGVGEGLNVVGASPGVSPTA